MKNLYTGDFTYMIKCTSFDDNTENHLNTTMYWDEKFLGENYPYWFEKSADAKKFATLEKALCTLDYLLEHKPVPDTIVYTKVVDG
jgi:hypothetical protein